jgi:restriction system protein
MESQIPHPQDFLNPALKVLKNSTVPLGRNEIIRQAVEEVISTQNLPPEIKSITRSTKSKSGHAKKPYFIIENNASWAISYLCIGGYITNEKQRGFWEITKLGIESYPVDQEEVATKVKAFNKQRMETRQALNDKNPDEVYEDEYSEPILIAKEKEQDWKSEILTKLQNLEPQEFEKFCGQFLKQIGFENVIVTQQSRDGGFDASASLRQNILSTRVLIECKKWKDGNHVGQSVVNQLRGVMKTHHVERGVIFTTSDFTKDAYQSARNVGDIELINGEEICNLMKKNNFGIIIEMVPKIRMDSKFIEGLIR